VPHPVLGKWLYLPARHDDFERLAVDLANRIARGDPRLGIEPKLNKPGTPDSAAQTAAKGMTSSLPSTSTPAVSNSNTRRRIKRLLF